MNQGFPKPQVACSSLAGVTDGENEKEAVLGTRTEVRKRRSSPAAMGRIQPLAAALLGGGKGDTRP